MWRELTQVQLNKNSIKKKRKKNYLQQLKIFKND